MTSGRCWQLRCYPAAWLHQDLARKCKGQRKARRRPAEVKGGHASCWLLRAGLDSRWPGRWQRKHTSILSNGETICWITLKTNVAASPAKTSRRSLCLLQCPPGAVLRPFCEPMLLCSCLPVHPLLPSSYSSEKNIALLYTLRTSISASFSFTTIFRLNAFWMENINFRQIPASASLSRAAYFLQLKLHQWIHPHMGSDTSA